jgi:hypothetical protein
MNLKRAAFLGLTLTLISVAGCSKKTPMDKMNQTHTDQSLTTKQPTTKTHQHQKPGAKVRFSHNYKGYSEVSEIENIELVFTDGYSTGQMQLKLKSDEALSLEPSTMDYMFSLEDYNSNKIKLSIQSHTEGKHFLNIFAMVTDANGYSSGRVFSIAFYVGENAKNKIGPQDPKAESVIRLPSIEMSEPTGSP